MVTNRIFGLLANIFISGVISCAILAQNAAQAADNAVSVELLMQKAYYAQRSEGDMEKAIDLYSQVIAQNAADRQYAGQACFELGQCYQTTGDNAKAVEYFRKVVTDYKDVEKWQAKAAAKLTELGVEAVSDSDSSTLQHQVNQTDSPKTENLVLKHDDDTPAEKYSIAGSCQIVRFNTETTKLLLDEVRIFGSRYGEAKAPNEDFTVYICDEKFKPIKEMNFPYSKFSRRGAAKWYSLKFAPIEVSGVFYVAVDFNAESTKGVYVYYDKEPSGYSFTGSPNVKPEGFDKGDWMVRASGKVVKQTTQDAVLSAPHLLPAPWSDGDSFKLDIKLKTGVSIGSLTYSFTTVEKSGRQCWQIAGEQVTDVGTGKTRQDTLVVADKETYRPVYGSTENTLGSFAADYSEKSVALKVKDGTSQNIAVDGVVYDNEQVLCMLRMLPLADNYACKFNIFPVLSGQVLECQIKVIATETVNVPAGKYPCYKVALSCWSNGAKALEHYIWVSSDDKRNIVKYDAGAAEMVLTQINGQASAVVAGGPGASVVAAVVSREDKKAAQALAAAAWKLWGQQNLAEAQEKFTQATVKDPSNDNAFQGLGWALFNQGKNIEAAEAFTKCIALNPKNSAAFNGLGYIARAGGDMDKAVDNWKKAVEAFPGATASLSGLVDYYTENGDDEQVVKYLKLWYKAEPNNTEVAEKLKAAQGKDSAQGKGVQVISTNPEVYSGSVPATLEAIEVTFNATMKNGGWSWTGGGDTYPESAGSISYDSKRRTCRMPVRLQPGKVYWVGINSPSHKNFKSAKGEPAQRYVILFATAAADGSPTDIPQDMLESARAINESK
ncbi:MAG: tetratricopeptide repeat protein [Sedimentisphaerales bacterium]|nr:tetratricopeptide repeat protein [Sedimentisphaerales bacterium]MBN2841938.1 tetratricopeptide repeat protein [Sedimentisphaerales bacterium]